MSSEITAAFVKQYSANIYNLAQQKKSRLRDKVRVESVTGEEAFFDQIGATYAVKLNDRHGDTPRIDTPHSRRRVAPEQYAWSDMIDTFDKVKMLGDPSSNYIQAGSFALGRGIDDEIIAAATGTSYTGKTGTTQVSLPSAQQVGVQVGGSSSNVGLNLEKLIAAKSRFGKNDVDVDDPMNKLYIAVSQQQIDDLLAIEKLTSADYASVKALQQGDINTFMGFEFVRLERLALNASTDIRTCFAWAKSGICLGINKDITARVSELPTKNYSWQAYACMSVGATRMEEEKVVSIACDESP